MNSMQNQMTILSIKTLDEQFHWESVIENSKKSTHVFDFRGVDFLDLHLLRALKTTINSIENRFVANVSPALMKVLKTAGIDATRIHVENPA